MDYEKKTFKVLRELHKYHRTECLKIDAEIKRRCEMDVEVKDNSKKIK